MFLSEPGRTSYDINFSFFGFPVRVHPAFFILPLLLGKEMVSGMNMGVGLLLAAGIFFVSILIHELGHAIAFRHYGIPSRIVLYWMGGLAIPDRASGGWTGKRTGSLNSNQQIVVSMAGPIFGFLLAVALVGVVYLIGGTIAIGKVMNVIPMPYPMLDGTMFAKSQPMLLLLGGGIVLNIVLNVFNLVPIYPLDGGQVARQVMLQMDPQDGARNSIYLSIAAAVLIAVFCIVKEQAFMGFFFGFMAYSNYQTLQRFSGPRW